MGRKRYRRVNPHQVRLWQDRLEAVHARLGNPPESLIEDATDVREGLGRAFPALGRLIEALTRIAAVHLDDAEESDFLVLCEVLAPRLARYADEDRNIAPEALLHAAALALDHDLAMFEELGDKYDEMHLLDRRTREAELAEADAESKWLASGAALMAWMESVDPDDVDGQMTGLLHKILAQASAPLADEDGDGPAEVQPGHLLKEQLAHKAALLLGQAQARGGAKPD